MHRAVVVGAGYVGRVAADLLAAQGWEVTGIVRTVESKPGEVAARAFDVTDASAVRENAGLFTEAEAILYCVSSGGGGPEVYRAAYVTGLCHILQEAKSARLVFTSSTSVYAQTNGEVVTEESSAEPESATGRILREAEEIALAHGGMVARLGGIYGPGRSVYLRKFMEGSAVIEGDGSRVVNQIHRDDAAAGLVRLVSGAARPAIYNIVDDTPMTQREVYELLARQFDRPLPPAGVRDLQRKRGWTSKKVSNARLRALGWRAEFPGYGDAIRRWGASLLDP